MLLAFTLSAMSLLVAGEALVDLVADEPGDLAGVESFTRRPGGSGANVATALARLDRSPSFWCRVGEDAFGDVVVEALAAAGVPTDRVQHDPTANTALVVVSRAPDGDPSFTAYREGTADTRMEPGTVGDEALAETDWVHCVGVTLTDEPARSATYDLAERAAAAGCTVSFDPNARPRLWDGFDYADSVERMLDHVDVVMASRGDLAAAGIERRDPGVLARDVCGRGPHTAFVTLGADGAVGVAEETATWGPAETRHDGFAVDAVDATGAGDAFAAGAMTALSEGHSLSETLSFANAVGALTTTARGAMAAQPGRDEVAVLRRDR
jgi:fructokinase